MYLKPKESFKEKLFPRKATNNNSQGKLIFTFYISYILRSTKLYVIIYT